MTQTGDMTPAERRVRDHLLDVARTDGFQDGDPEQARYVDAMMRTLYAQRLLLRETLVDLWVAIKAVFQR